MGSPPPMGMRNPQQPVPANSGNPFLQNFAGAVIQASGQGPQPNGLRPNPGAGPMSFAPPPNGQMRGTPMGLAASGNNGYNYTPNRFQGQPPPQRPPMQAPPAQAAPPAPQLAQQQAQIAMLRGRPVMARGRGGN